MLIGNIPAAVVAMGNMGVHRGAKVALAADVQAGVIVHADELGTGGTLAVVVIQRLIRHQQLQKLVAAGAQRADFRDRVRIVIYCAETGDAAFHLALDEQVGRTDAALRAGILTGSVGDVVDHHAYDAAIAALGFAGQQVGIISRQCADPGIPCRERCCTHVPRPGRGRSGLTGSGRAGCSAAQTESFLKPGRKAAAHGSLTTGAAGKSQRRSGSAGETKNGTASDLHTKNLLYKNQRVPEKMRGMNHSRRSERKPPAALQTVLI